jgi:hypothetical protein
MVAHGGAPVLKRKFVTSPLGSGTGDDLPTYRE